MDPSTNRAFALGVQKNQKRKVMKNAFLAGEIGAYRRRTPVTQVSITALRIGDLLCLAFGSIDRDSRPIGDLNEAAAAADAFA